jgi:hypothetical protein
MAAASALIIFFQIDSIFLAIPERLSLSGRIINAEAAVVFNKI